MLLRAEKVDLLTIALWLGHESTTSTEIYMHADNKLKQETIDRIAPAGTPPGRYQPPDRVLAFLDRLSYPQRELRHVTAGPRISGRPPAAGEEDLAARISPMR